MMIYTCCGTTVGKPSATPGQVFMLAAKQIRTTGLNGSWVKWQADNTMAVTGIVC